MININMKIQIINIFLVLLILFARREQSRFASALSSSSPSPQILNRAITRSNNITTNFYEGVYHSAVIDYLNQKGYFGTFTVPGLVVRIDLPTMAREANLASPVGFGRFRSGLEICGMIYLPCSTSPQGGFVAIKSSRFEIVATRLGEPGESNFVAPVSYLDYIVFGTQSSPAYLIEYNLATFDRTSRNLTLPTSNVKASVSKGAVAYFILGPIGGSICKVDLSIMKVLEFYSNSALSDFSTVSGAFDPNFGSTFYYDSATDLIRYLHPTSSSSVTAAKIAAKNSSSYPLAFLYIATGANGASFHKFEVTENVTLINQSSPFSPAGLPASITLRDSITSPTIQFVVGSFIVRDYVFFMQASSIGVLYRVNASNFSFPVFTDYNLNYTYLNTTTGAALDSPVMPWIDNISGADYSAVVTDGAFAYVATNSFPGAVIKYDLGLSSVDSTTYLDKFNSSYFSSSSPTVGTIVDNFGMMSTDINTTFSCVRRGTYIGYGFALRLSSSNKGIVQIRVSNSSLWGVISNDHFNANTAAGICHMLGHNATWATFFTVGHTPYNNTVTSRAVTNTSQSSSSNVTITLTYANTSTQSASTTTTTMLTSSSNLTIILTYANTSTFASTTETSLSSIGNFTVVTDITNTTAPSSSNFTASTSTSTTTPYLADVALLQSVHHPLDVPVFFDDLRCPVDANYIDNCTFKLYNLNDAAPTESVGVNCLAQTSESEDESGVVSGDWKFRLARNGRLEVKPLNASSATYNTNGWGTMCNKGMSRFTPSALCRILGFPSGIGHLTHWINSATNSGLGDLATQNSTPIYMSQVSCPATMEAGKFDSACTFDRYNFTEFNQEISWLSDTRLHSYNPDWKKFCNHSYDVGLLCNSSTASEEFAEGVYAGQRFFVRQNPETNGIQVRKIAGVSASNQNIYATSGWTSVCKQKMFWMTDAILLCKWLGYPAPKSYVGIFSLSPNETGNNSRGLSNFYCGENMDVANIGQCNYIDHVANDGSNSAIVCEEELGLICDAEEKGIKSGGFYWRVTQMNNSKNNVSGISSSSSSLTTTDYFLQARPVPSFVASDNVSKVNAYPVMENFGAVESFNSGISNNSVQFTQTDANLICKILGFSHLTDTSNHTFSTAQITISDPLFDRLGSVRNISANSTNISITSNFWNQGANYDAQNLLDKIALRNISCSSANYDSTTLAGRSTAMSTEICPSYEFSVNTSAYLKVQQQLEISKVINSLNSNTNNNNNDTNSSATSSIDYATAAVYHIKTGGEYDVVTLYCDPFMYVPREQEVMYKLSIGIAFAAFFLAFLILLFLICVGCLNGTPKYDEEEAAAAKELLEKKQEEIRIARKGRPLPPPPPMRPVSEASDDDERDENNNNNNHRNHNNTSNVSRVSRRPPPPAAFNGTFNMHPEPLTHDDDDEDEVSYSRGQSNSRKNNNNNHNSNNNNNNNSDVHIVETFDDDDGEEEVITVSPKFNKNFVFDNTKFGSEKLGTSNRYENRYSRNRHVDANEPVIVAPVVSPNRYQLNQSNNEPIQSLPSSRRHPAYDRDPAANRYAPKNNKTNSYLDSSPAFTTTRYPTFESLSNQQQPLSSSRQFQPEYQRNNSVPRVITSPEATNKQTPSSPSSLREPSRSRNLYETKNHNNMISPNPPGTYYN